MKKKIKKHDLTRRRTSGTNEARIMTTLRDIIKHLIADHNGTSKSNNRKNKLNYTNR
jgi:hypothetical protein